MTVDKKIALTTACFKFFEALQELDMHDHPEVFKTLDDVARAQGFAIRAEQSGIFGTKLSFCRVEDL